MDAVADQSVELKLLEEKVCRRLNKRGFYDWLIDDFGGGKKISAATTSVKRVSYTCNYLTFLSHIKGRIYIILGGGVSCVYAHGVQASGFEPEERIQVEL